LDNLPHFSGVSGDDGIAVHHRFVVGGGVDVARYVLGKHPAEGVGQGETRGCETPDMGGDGGEGLVDREHEESLLGFTESGISNEQFSRFGASHGCVMRTVASAKTANPYA